MGGCVHASRIAVADLARPLDARSALVIPESPRIVQRTCLTRIAGVAEVARLQASRRIPNSGEFGYSPWDDVSKINGHRENIARRGRAPPWRKSARPLPLVMNMARRRQAPPWPSPVTSMNFRLPSPAKTANLRLMLRHVSVDGSWHGLPAREIHGQDGRATPYVTRWGTGAARPKCLRTRDGEPR